VRRVIACIRLVVDIAAAGAGGPRGGFDEINLAPSPAQLDGIVASFRQELFPPGSVKGCRCGLSAALAIGMSLPLIGSDMGDLWICELRAEKMGMEEDAALAGSRRGSPPACARKGLAGKKPERMAVRGVMDVRFRPAASRCA